ncbi:DUF1993 domain-containing protein [Sphingomonas sp. AR_OL41]|jgi:hypothetical protein|uniref:DUF1993 domain-containing protein n=1 Tax=Sphingomonas sp. AR_OL41 TaxID=3042729 RepID=UPI00247FC286|nr:DUF1993 domain-containing protein [Sphingomonas sp. AR_OL41]MDH7972455.1 DUF1993 domain-containing protein [Sphingomonas sp. AR_OL41]
MSFTLYDASVPVFTNILGNMRSWLDKAAAEKPEAELLEARLAPDMRPLPAQYQMASDSAKNALARLRGVDAPSMPDTEGSFAELQARCDKTIAFLQECDAASLAGAEDRTVELRFPNGMGYRFTGADYLTGFALPNFFFHATTAYAILRASGVALGKPDFLQHLGAPNLSANA